MPSDSSIYGLVQQPQQLAAPMNPLAALAQAYQIKAYQGAADKADRETQSQNKLLELVGGADFAKMPTAQKATALQGVGAFDQAGKLVTTEAAANKDQRSADSSAWDLKAKKLTMASMIAGTAKDQSSYEHAIGMLSGLDIDTSQFSPTYDPAGVAQFAEATLTAKDRLLAAQEAQKLGETKRHNSAIEGTAAGNLRVAQDNYGVARDRLEYEKGSPKGEVVQTDSGVMLVDKRSGTAQPVTADGQPIQRPGKEIPASVNKSIMENQQNIAKIRRAVAEIDKNPDALGLANMIPFVETARQYTNPEGVDARAGVADIGSLVLHDRSGAAVTVSETPRLRPFIPSASDRPEVAKKKLARFLEIYEEEAGLLSQTYNKSQGYRESPVLESNGRAAGAPTAPGPVARIAQQAKPMPGLGGKPAAADLSGLEAEMKRRGLLK
jgi:hypothetical protein